MILFLDLFRYVIYTVRSKRQNYKRIWTARGILWFFEKKSCWCTVNGLKALQHIAQGNALGEYGQKHWRAESAKADMQAKRMSVNT